MKTIDCSRVFNEKGNNSIVALTEMLHEEFEGYVGKIRIKSANPKAVTWSNEEVAFILADGINCHFTPKKAKVLDVVATLSTGSEKALEGSWCTDKQVPYFEVLAIKYKKNRYE